MRIKPNLIQEYEELAQTYREANVQGRDLMTLVEMFGNEYDYLVDDSHPTEYAMVWRDFLEEHQHQMTVFPEPMVALLINILGTYWQQGERLYEALPTLEKMVVRDLVADMSREISRRIDETTGLQEVVQ